jgi:hypothetical protein
VTTTGVSPDGGSRLPVALGRAFPNPVLRGSATIPFTAARSGRVTIRVLDLSGRSVRVLFDDVVAAGDRTVAWDGRDDRGEPVPRGIYFYRLDAPGYSASRKLVKLK